ncbi:MAG TPA: hypothetical protein PLA90_13220 [Candidatus Sumerlaeota bacterium]|nr:hypothetical protein [Candidatus Sumerlaeota bacterium]
MKRLSPLVRLFFLAGEDARPETSLLWVESGSRDRQSPDWREKERGKTHPAGTTTDTPYMRVRGRSCEIALQKRNKIIPFAVSADSGYSGVDFGNEFFPQKGTGEMQNERVEIRGFGPWKRIALSLLVGAIFGCFPTAQSQAAEPATIQANDTPTSAPVRRDWKAEYPKLMEMGFKERPSRDGMGGGIAHQKILLRDLLEALNLKRNSLRRTPSSSAASRISLYLYATLDSMTRLSIMFISIEDARKDLEGFVSVQISHYPLKDEVLRSKHISKKGTVDSYGLMAQHFQMVKPGVWIRGDIRVDEVMELFQHDVADSSRVYKPDDASPGTYKIRGDVTIQFPSVQPVSSLKDLSPDTLTTVTVVGATPEDPFPYKPDLTSDLARALLDAGFEYKRGARFEKRGLTYGEAKAVTKSRELPADFDERKHKALKPHRKGGSISGSAFIFFESQEANPTWSDDTKVDVYVYFPPQMDEVVKSLKK